MTQTRRQLLKQALCGSGYIGLQSLATGLPISALMHGIPRAADAAEPKPAQHLILISHAAGDPVNANAPGAYGIPGVVNNPHPELAPRNFRLGTQETRAALPWSPQGGLLPSWAYERTSFIHHRTYQNAHPQYDSVMTLVGSAKNSEGGGAEHLASLYASENAAALGTIQVEPISLFRGVMSFEGRAIQSVLPGTLSQMFTAPQGLQLDLANRRRQKLDEIHAALRANGTTAQRRWLDRHASSHAQARDLDTELLQLFSSIDGNGETAMIDAAIGLIRMNVSPVIRIHIAFGGDNHADPDLLDERDETLTGIAAIGYMMNELDAAGLRDQVTIANLHTFGRTLGSKGTAGRDHNLNHHVMMLSGANVNPGVIGKIEVSGNDFGATGIDSATGAGGANTDIPANETLEATAKTLGTAIGVPLERLETRITGGRPIDAAIK